MPVFGGSFTAIPLPFSSQLRVEDGCGSSSACRLFTMFRAAFLSNSRPEAPASFRLYLLSLLFYTPRSRQSIQAIGTRNGPFRTILASFRKKLAPELSALPKRRFFRNRSDGQRLRSSCYPTSVNVAGGFVRRVFNFRPEEWLASKCLFVLGHWEA